ncbi:MAG: hypothetical protein AAF917_13665, partial [Pseudomonadota bacterium]
GAIAGITSGASAGITTGAIAGNSSGSVAGITTGAIAGITSGASAGITTGAIAGITTGAIAGITTGAIAGITSGASAGITTGAIAGITSGASAGITTGAIAGINSGSIAGITTGAIAGTTPGAIEHVVNGSQPFSSGSPGENHSEESRVLHGPVESVDLINGVFTSMGQTIVASTTMLRDLNEGDYVTVNGSVMGTGWLYADEIAVSDDMYVPGSSPVLVTGIMSEVDDTVGSATVGGLMVDFTQALSNGSFPQGNLYIFSGIQPVEDGILLSTEVLATE